jgi:hypothetical protein
MNITIDKEIVDQFNLRVEGQIGTIAVTTDRERLAELRDAIDRLLQGQENDAHVRL